ncbi:unnamed protein product, partial [Choristocarpus tenellus]
MDHIQPPAAKRPRVGESDSSPVVCKEYGGCMSEVHGLQGVGLPSLADHFDRGGDPIEGLSDQVEEGRRVEEVGMAGVEGRRSDEESSVIGDGAQQPRMLWSGRDIQYVSLEGMHSPSHEPELQRIKFGQDMECVTIQSSGSDVGDQEKSIHCSRIDNTVECNRGATDAGAAGSIPSGFVPTATLTHLHEGVAGRGPRGLDYLDGSSKYGTSDHQGRTIIGRDLDPNSESWSPMRSSDKPNLLETGPECPRKRPGSCVGPWSSTLSPNISELPVPSQGTGEGPGLGTELGTIQHSGSHSHFPSSPATIDPALTPANTGEIPMATNNQTRVAWIQELGEGREAPPSILGSTPTSFTSSTRTNNPQAVPSSLGIGAEATGTTRGMGDGKDTTRRTVAGEW